MPRTFAVTIAASLSRPGAAVVIATVRRTATGGMSSRCGRGCRTCRTSEPPAHPRSIGIERGTEQDGERLFLRFDLKTVHVENEQRKEKQAKHVRQEDGPPSQDQEKTKIHGVSGEGIDARG